MSLLIVALVLFLIHAFRGVWPDLRQRIFSGLFSLGFRALHALGLHDRLGILLLTGVTVGVVGGIQYALLRLDPTWPWFVFSLLVLLLAWGSRDLDEDVGRFLDADDPDQAWEAARPLVFSYRGPAPGSHREAVIKGVFYQGLVRWFGVLFWFLVLGAAGALLFRIPHALLGEAVNRERMNARQVGLMERLATALDLVPAALTTLSLALVGNFDAVVAAWRRHFRERHRPALAWDYEFLPEVGFQTVCEGGRTDEAFDHDYEGARAEVSTAMSLVWRALMAWLTVMALMILAGLIT